MKTYKVTTPNPGLLIAVEDFPPDQWRKDITAATSRGEGVSMDGTELLRVQLADRAPKEGEETAHRMKGFFFNRNASNHPHVFKFKDRWWVRAKRSRRDWEAAKGIGSHVICGTKLTLTKENARIFRAMYQGRRPSSVATWLPWHKRDEDGCNIFLFYEVFWL